MKNQIRRLGWHSRNVGALLLVAALAAHAQQPAATSSATSESAAIQALADSLRQLQAQMQSMQDEMRNVRTERDEMRAELADLKRNLAATKSATLAPEPAVADATTQSSFTAYPTAASVATGDASEQTPQALNTDDRVARLEESAELAEARLAENSQTKVESGSKYRVRLSGMIMLNMFENRGNADSIDVPEIAVAQNPLLGSRGSFGGTLRQSIIGLDVFGPQIAGAHTSADVKFDFAGGFPYQSNGVSAGLVRLRTGVIRLDWKNTSLVAGQDSLFFVPVSPTSLASVAVPALSYAGNLWAWTPQVRVEHRITLTENSTLTLQGGILDSLTGEVPSENSSGRYPSWGEQSGHPSVASRVALGQRMFGQNVVLGVGAFFGRETWGLNRDLDDAAGTMDFTIPLGRFFGLSGLYYRGQSVAGLGGGIGQSVLWSGNIMNPATGFHGLKSEGGWAQLKFTPRPKFEINSGFGQDNPFAKDLRRYGPNGSYYGPLLSRNQSSFANFIYKPRSDVMFSLEYRHLKTNILDSGSQQLNHVNAALAYTF